MSNLYGSQIKSGMTRNGFTLIELVVVMAIVVIVGTMLVIIFSSTLRGSNKAQMLSVIKQGGQAVLEDMDKTFRGADNVICPVITEPLTTQPSTQVVIYTKKKVTSSETENIYTRYRFIAPTSTANGLIRRDSRVKQDNQDYDQFISDLCNPNDPQTGSTVLTDTTPETGVSVTDGLFTRSIKAGSKDSIKVQFTLNPGVRAPAVIVGQIDPVIFQTTVGLR